MYLKYIDTQRKQKDEEVQRFLAEVKEKNTKAKDAEQRRKKERKDVLAEPYNGYEGSLFLCFSVPLFLLLCLTSLSYLLSIISCRWFANRSSSQLCELLVETRSGGVLCKMIGRVLYGVKLPEQYLAEIYAKRLREVWKDKPLKKLHHMYQKLRYPHLFEKPNEGSVRVANGGSIVVRSYMGKDGQHRDLLDHFATLRPVTLLFLLANSASALLDPSLNNLRDVVKLFVPSTLQAPVYGILARRSNLAPAPHATSMVSLSTFSAFFLSCSLIDFLVAAGEDDAPFQFVQMGSEGVEPGSVAHQGDGLVEAGVQDANHQAHSCHSVAMADGGLSVYVCFLILSSHSFIFFTGL